MNQSVSSSIIDTTWIKSGNQSFIQKSILGQACWLEIIDNKFSEEIFLAGRMILVQKQQQKVECQIKDQQSTLVVPFKHLYQRVDDEKRKNQDDLVNLECLNDPELLENLKIRFQNDITQTYVGPTLLVANPYKAIPNIYSVENIKAYYSHILEKGTHALAYKEMPPHVYAISAESFSGESGAGKTENTKLCMKFITSIGRLRQSTENKLLGNGGLGQNKSVHNQQFSEGIEKKVSLQIDQNYKILSCNPILEALGNCKTNRNYNSSRFGKYVTIIVEKETRKIVGAQIRNYLLEKSRIIQQALNERNFHIFYQLIFSGSSEMLKQFNLSKQEGPEYYEYLKKSKCYEIDPKLVNDRKEFSEVIEGLNVLGFKESQYLIWKIISSVLKLGNIQFDDLHQSQSDNSPCNVRTEKLLEEIAQLLQIPIDLLKKELLFKQFKQGQQIILKPLKQIECVSKRDALAKFLYDKLFNWVVSVLNKTLITPEIAKNLSNEKKYLKIGLLDIYGFEVFEKNFFEQFFINYTNERLQQLYIGYVFKEEELIFVKEGLGDFLKKLEFKDNQTVIDLLDNDKPPNLGIFNILDDCCQSASTDDGLLAKIKKTNEKNKLFKAPKFAGTSNFTIIHTAKDVEYTVHGFIEKNKDDIKTFEALVQQSSDHEYLQQLVEQNLDESTSNQKNFKSQKFSSARFRKEMSDLMNELLKCDVHFIRCIKPNEEKLQNIWNSKLCLSQIRYLGVLETIRVRKESYPIRREYRLFYKRYGLLMSNNDPYSYLVENSADFRELTKQIFQQHFAELDDNEVLFGNTKIFLRIQTLDYLEEYYLKATYQMQRAAKRFQVNYYRYKKLKEFREYRQKVIKIQRFYKTRIDRKRFLKNRQNVIKIQRTYRRIYFEKNRKNIMKSVKTIQSYVKSAPFFNIHLKALQIIKQTQRRWRYALQKIKFKNLQKIRRIITQNMFDTCWKKIEFDASILINKNIRGYYVRKHNWNTVIRIRHAGSIVKDTKAALIIQKYARGYIVRNILRRMNRAAFFIQGFFKMRWLTYMFQRVRKAATIIQQSARSYIYTQKEKNQSNSGFIGQLEMEIDSLRYSQSLTLFSDDNQINKCLDITYEQMFGKKVYLFNYIIDFEILSDINEIYENETWADFYSKNFKENFQKANFLQYIAVGEAHTVMLSLGSKAKLFGWNDFGQLGHNPVESDLTYHNNLQFLNRAKSISCGKNHNILLDISGNLYSWGQNSRGQLGLGHFEASIFTPTRVNPQNIQNFKIAKSRDDYNVAITDDGRIFQWPINKKVSLMTEIPLKKVYINNVTLGKNFVVTLSQHGLLYSWGENTQGQLGVGDTQKRENPTLIESLRDAGEKIHQIECGFGHCIAKTTLGKVYTWGWGKRGQLGHNSYKSEIYPRHLLLNANKTGKILQVMASYQSSIIMSEQRKIYWFGSNSQIKNQNVASELILSSINKRFGEGTIYDALRVTSSWSDTKSLIQITFANTKNFFEKQKSMKYKTLNNLTQKWIESGIDSSKTFYFNAQIVDPPYVQNLNNYISEKHMKMPIIKPNIQFESKVQYKNLISQIKQQESEILSDQSQHLNSSIPDWLLPQKDDINASFDAESYKKYPQNYDYLGPLRPLVNMSVQQSPNKSKPGLELLNYTQMQSQPQKSEMEQLEEKGKSLQQCKKHESLLLQTPYYKWTQADLEFMESIKNLDFDKMEDKIQNQKSQLLQSQQSSQLSEQTMNQLQFIKQKLKNLKDLPRDQWTENDIEMVKKASQITKFK